MKLQFDTDKKTVAFEGSVKVADVFNHLIKWFPETWEEWTFVPFKNSVEEIIVEREIWKNPYWNPWQPIYYSSPGLDTGTPITNPYQITSGITTLKLN